nr:hypothetical protein [Clostridia bacterium]
MESLKRYLSTKKSDRFTWLIAIVCLALLAFSIWVWSTASQDLGGVWEGLRYLLSAFKLEDFVKSLKRIAFLLVLPFGSVYFLYGSIRALRQSAKTKKQLNNLLQHSGEELVSDFTHATIFVHNSFRLGEKYLYIQNHGLPIANHDLVRVTFYIKELITDSSKRDKKGNYTTEPYLQLMISDTHENYYTAFSIKPHLIDKWQLSQIKEAFRARNSGIKISDMTEGKK